MRIIWWPFLIMSFTTSLWGFFGEKIENFERLKIWKIWWSRSVFFSRKKRFHLLKSRLYQIGKAQNMPVLDGRLVIITSQQWPKSVFPIRLKTRNFKTTILLKYFAIDLLNIIPDNFQPRKIKYIYSSTNYIFSSSIWNKFLVLQIFRKSIQSCETDFPKSREEILTRYLESPVFLFDTNNIEDLNRNSEVFSCEHISRDRLY